MKNIKTFILQQQCLLKMKAKMKFSHEDRNEFRKTSFEVPDSKHCELDE